MLTTETTFPQIGINPFVTRQTAESQFSYYDGDINDICKLVQDSWELRKLGYRDGVVLVQVDPQGFFSSTCELTEGDMIVGTYAPRRPGEKPRKQLGVVSGKKIPAKRVDIVLYNSTVLAENNDNALEPSQNNWEVVSINATIETEATPIAVGTLIANHLELSGGTATKMTDAEFVQQLRISVEYHGTKMNCADAKWLQHFNK